MLSMPRLYSISRVNSIVITSFNVPCWYWVVVHTLWLYVYKISDAEDLFNVCTADWYIFTVTIINKSITSLQFGSFCLFALKFSFNLTSTSFWSKFNLRKPFHLKDNSAFSGFSWIVLHCIDIYISTACYWWKRDYYDSSFARRNLINE